MSARICEDHHNDEGDRALSTVLTQLCGLNTAWRPLSLFNTGL